MERVLKSMKAEAKRKLSLIDQEVYWQISVHIVRECDLRATLQEKAFCCNEHTKWTAFVNRAGTLIHVLPLDGDFHIRIPLYYSIKNESDSQIERLVKEYAQGRLI